MVLILVYALLPWIPIGGFPAVFLDVAKGQFHLFGMTLLAQDLWLSFFIITGMGFGLFYVTALFGRVWCGWACPQTVFLETVYRTIERWIEGDATARRRLDSAEWNGSKLMKRIAKHTLFIMISVIIAHLFLSYFVSLPGLYELMRHSPLENWKLFLFVFALSVLLYGNFAWFREQFCIVLCPYGRLQSALLDEHSIIIGYDETRGEPRGKPTDPSHGDCIDCRRCVQVCPTGIDIRNGLQMECIGCANCIDACDDIMEKLGRPLGLVRYDSQSGLGGRTTRLVRPRTLLYSALLIAGVLVMTYSLSTIRTANLSVTRLPGAPYILNSEVLTVRNNYYVRLINKRPETQLFDIQVRATDGTPFHQVNLLEPLLVPANDEINTPLIIVVDQKDFRGAFTMEIRALPSEGGRPLIRNIQFLGPDVPE